MVIKKAYLVVDEDQICQLESRKEVRLFLQDQALTMGFGKATILRDPCTLQLEEVVTETNVEVISCQPASFDEYIPTGFLPILMQLGRFSGYFDALDFLPFDDGRKYTSQQKSMVLIAALASACSHNVAINDHLKPYPALAQYFQLQQIPDQCTINRYLQGTQAVDLSYLQLILEETQKRLGLWRLDSTPVDVDLDSTGLVVYGETYEGANKGFLSGHRGRKGYQLNLGICSNTAECLAFTLDPASVSPGQRFWDILYSIAEVVGGFEQIGLIRADAIHGTKDNMQLLLERDASFLLKGRDPRTARKLAKDIPSFQWETMDIAHEVAEAQPLTLSSKHAPVRTILVKTKNANKIKYSHLYTTISSKEKEPIEIAHHYNQRQIIEAEIKAERNGPQLNHLRTRSFFGIYNFMYHLILAMNLVLLFRHTVLKGTILQEYGLQEITTKMMNIPAKVENKNSLLVLNFPEKHPMVQKFFRGKTEFTIC